MSRARWIASILCLLSIAPASAGVTTKAMREALEVLTRKFGNEVAEEGAETIATKVTAVGAKYGDEGLTAVRKCGPRTFRVLEEVGEHGAEAVKLMARQGDDAFWVVADKNRMTIFIKYGDRAADAMIKHRGVAEPVISKFGAPAAGALTKVSKQNGRRLAMIVNDGALSKAGKANELLTLIEARGDQAMEFIWKNKGALIVGTTCVAFLNDPQPFIEGARDLSEVAAENIGKPLVEMQGEALREVAKGVGSNTNWTWILSLTVMVGGLLVGLILLLRRWRMVPHRPTVNK